MKPYILSVAVIIASIFYCWHKEKVAELKGCEKIYISLIQESIGEIPQEQLPEVMRIVKQRCQVIL